MLEKITGQKTFKDAFKKVAWFRFTIIITIAVFLIIGVIEAINNPVKPTKPVNSTPTTKAQSTTTSPKIEKNKKIKQKIYNKGHKKYFWFNKRNFEVL